MGMNPRGRVRGRNHNNFNNNRRFGNNNGGNAPSRNTVYDSTGPAGRLRGTAYQLMEKYQQAAKDAMATDRVLAENCLQHADHYSRLNAAAIANEQRFNPAYQQQPDVADDVVETADVIESPVDNPIEETANGAEQIEAAPEPVAKEPVPEAEELPLHKRDLSVPVAQMAERENKRKRLSLPVKKDEAAPAAPVAAEQPAPRRRGRPPRAKTVVPPTPAP